MYAILIGAAIGAMIGLIPVMFGAIKNQLKLGIAGFIASVIAGGILGVFLSIPISGVFVWLISSNYNKNFNQACPYCAEQIKINALVCKHCGRDVLTDVSNNGIHAGIPDFNDIKNNMDIAQPINVIEKNSAVMIYSSRKSIKKFMWILLVLIIGFAFMLMGIYNTLENLASTLGFAVGIFLVYELLIGFNIEVDLIIPAYLCAVFLLMLYYQNDTNSLFYGFVIFTPYIIAAILFIIYIPYKILSKRKIENYKQ